MGAAGYPDEIVRRDSQLLAQTNGLQIVAIAEHAIVFDGTSHDDLVGRNANIAKRLGVGIRLHGEATDVPEEQPSRQPGDLPVSAGAARAHTAIDNNDGNVASGRDAQ